MNVAAPHRPAPAPDAEAAAVPRWSIERRLGVGYALVATLILGMAALVCWQVGRLMRDDRWLDHTRRVIEELGGVYPLLSEIEGAQRGFTISGGEVQLQPYYTARRALPARLQALRELTADDPVQHAQFRRLTGAINEKLQHVHTRIEQRRELGEGALNPEFFVGSRGKELMDHLRDGLELMIVGERLTLGRHEAARANSLRATLISLGALGTALGGLLAGLFVAGNRELVDRRRMSRELEIARDEALEAARQKSEFLANMSHEIRTPLNGIVGMAGLLRERPLEPETQDCVNTIDTCAEALLGVINDVLDFSKLEAGRLTVAVAPFDLRVTVDETLAIVAPRASARGLELNVQIAGDVPAGLVGDAGRLRQVLLSLLGNAVKFTERGEVTLAIAHAVPRVGAGADVPVALRFDVRDTGIGIAPENRERLFRAFSQVDGSNTRRFGGTGLGLAIARELVARMGGEIGVESAPGAGSTFWFTARFVADPTLAGVRANGLPPSAVGLLANWRVLLAGDPSTDRRHAQGIFTRWGLFHQSADDGHRALAMLRLAAASGRPFHAALLDADLPGLNGRALAAEVRADAEVAGTRLLLLSDAPSGVEVTLSADLDARLPRPVRSRALLETLRRLAAAGSPPTSSSRPVAVVPVAAPVAPGAVVVPPREPDTAATGGPRVLLAEDNPINRKVALRQLNNLGCEAEAVKNGRELLTLVEDGESYDLILMDVQMPEMDGYETTRQLRARFWSAGVGPPVVAMTANVMGDDREKCLAAGMDDYLPKPVKQDALEAVLRRWLPLRAGSLTDARPRDRQTVSVG